MDSKETNGSEKDAPKPVKHGPQPKPAPLHPRELFGKGGKHQMQPSKGRSFRHQGR
jgi:hypothetical protein